MSRPHRRAEEAFAAITDALTQDAFSPAIRHSYEVIVRRTAARRG